MMFALFGCVAIVHFGADCVEGPQRSAADFIPPEAQKYFSFAAGAQWGEPVGVWHFAVQTLDQRYAYVDGGGYGESILTALTLFTEDSDWRQWSAKKELRVHLTLRVPGLPEYSRTVTEASTGFSGNPHGSCWTLSTQVSVYELRQFWGRVPPRISLVATLAEPELPAAATDAVSLHLDPIAPEDASWSQRVTSLRAGQTVQELVALLGRPTSSKTMLTAEGESAKVLLYPNPDAPADLPPELRSTEIHLDHDGRFLFAFHTMFGC